MCFESLSLVPLSDMMKKAAGMTDDSWKIDVDVIDDDAEIENRIAALPEAQREIGALALRYLFSANGPRSFPKDRKSAAEHCLSPVEAFVFQWLFKRTDGKLRRIYGAGVLDAIRRARYQCERCGFADVRALNLEKRVEKRVEKQGDDETVEFVCLCANCNTVESRSKEMATNALRASRAAQQNAE